MVAAQSLCFSIKTREPIVTSATACPRIHEPHQRIEQRRTATISTCVTGTSITFSAVSRCEEAFEDPRPLSKARQCRNRQN